MLKGFKNTEETSLKGAFKVLLDKYEDDRGHVLNVFDNSETHFNQEKLTVSKKHVLRGLHSDTKNDKLIYCLLGKMLLVVVNYDINSKQYLYKLEIEMDENSNFAIFVPKNFLNGHYCMSKKVYFYYKWSDGYVLPEEQVSVRWNSPKLDINWHLLTKEPILSDRDANSLELK